MLCVELLLLLPPVPVPHLALAELLLQQRLVLEEVLGDDPHLETRLELFLRPAVLPQPLQVFLERDAVSLAVPRFFKVGVRG